MSESIKFLKGIDGALKRSKFISIAALATSAVIAIAAFYMAQKRVSESSAYVYVLDNGSVLEARRMYSDAQLDLEIADHVRRYHELMFNISPDSDIIKSNFEQAVKLGGNCAVELYNRRNEQNIYRKFIEVSAVQTIRITETVVDMSREPYVVRTKGIVRVLREETDTEYDFNSECEVSRMENRSIDNPHGLMINRFNKVDQVQTSQKKVQRGTKRY